MILHATEIKCLEGLCLFVAFDNGASGTVDLAASLEGAMFEPLRDVALFRTARLHPLFKTVVWDNGADFAPEYLYELLLSQSKRAA